jgi:hypothetical protein
MDLMVRMVLILRRPTKVSRMTPKGKFIGCSKVLVYLMWLKAFCSFFSKLM